MDMKIKMLEAKFQEDKLKLQQKHDATVQKVSVLNIVMYLISCPHDVEDCLEGLFCPRFWIVRMLN